MPKVQICPYLGKADDPATPILFPSPVNSCFRAPKSITPDLEYQSATCLNAEHKTCPAFINVYDISAVPVYQSPSDIRNRTGKIVIIASLIALFLFLLIINLIGLGVIPGLKQEATPTPIPPPAPTNPLVFSPQPSPFSPVSTDIPLVTPTHTAFIPDTSTPTITFSPTPIARIGLDTVFGFELKFVIHRVRSGESLSQYANQYLSTVEVIQWANLNSLSPLRIDQLVVIPVASTVVDPQMPAFEAYQVQAASVPAQALAEDLETDLAQFLLYNGLQSDDVLSNGHWLIIPRPHP